jgi:hypothetical protein
MSTTQQPINDGGRAFPSLDAYGPKGMSLRDWFAGMALQGLVSNPDVSLSILSLVARHSLDIADAMIEARKKDYIIDRGEDK